MKLSVAIATYNGEMYLHEQLQSIAQQSRLPDEVIVSDDGSSDATKDILREFAANAPFSLQVFENAATLGPIKNFQRAIELCNGEIIVLSDQDDCWYPQRLSRIEQRFLSSPNVGLVFSDADLIDDTGRSLNSRLWQKTFRKQEQKRARNGRIFELLLQQDVLTGATMAFRSRFREIVLPFPSDIPLMHDGWIALIISAVADVGIEPQALIKYRLHRQQYLGIAHCQEPAGVPIKNQPVFPNRSARYLAQISKLAVVRQRLLEVAQDIGDAATRARLKTRIEYVEKLIAHLQARYELPNRRLSRGPVVLKELLTFRYHRFSRGMLSVLRDLTL